MSQSRQLAAIMFTDIVGYTALMGTDEQKAFQLLKKNREIQKPIIEEFNGKFIKELGDGLLASFTTVSDSVYAAIKIVESCKTKENISLRIGIHHGEIVFEKNDVFGDAVNIASRLQAIAPPGGILISESVHQNIANKHGIETFFVKEETLKNVHAPVRVYQVISEGHEDLLKSLGHTKRKKTILPDNQKKIAMTAGLVLLVLVVFWLYTLFSGKNPFARNSATSRNSIAVLPFTNMSNDKNNEYFSDGITENIITQLSKIKKLKVIGRTSSMLYKDSKKSIKDIADELNVAAILEGSVQKAGSQVSVTARLIDAKTQEQMWADSWDRNVDQILVVLSELAQQIASQLKLRLSAGEKTDIEKKMTQNIAAYEAYLKGKKLLLDFGIARQAYDDSLYKAEAYFLDALRADSAFALAWAGLSLAYKEIGANFENNRINYFLKKSLEAGIKGITYGPELSETHMMVGEVLKSLTLDPRSSLDELRKSISINPNNSQAHCLLAFACSEAGLFKEAEASLIKARELDPLSELMRLAWVVYYRDSRNLEGLKNFDRDFNTSSRDVKIYYHFLTDKFDSLLYYSNLYSLAYWKGIAYAALRQTDNAQKIIDSLQKNSPSLEDMTVIGVMYGWLNESDKAIDLLEKSFYMKNSTLVGIKVDKLYDPLRNEKRFIELLRKMGLE